VKVAMGEKKAAYVSKGHSYAKISSIKNQKCSGGYGVLRRGGLVGDTMKIGPSSEVCRGRIRRGNGVVTSPLNEHVRETREG